MSGMKEPVCIDPEGCTTDPKRVQAAMHEEFAKRVAESCASQPITTEERLDDMRKELDSMHQAYALLQERNQIATGVLHTMSITLQGQTQLVDLVLALSRR